MILRTGISLMSPLLCLCVWYSIDNQRWFPWRPVSSRRRL